MLFLTGEEEAQLCQRAAVAANPYLLPSSDPSTPQYHPEGVFIIVWTDVISMEIAISIQTCDEQLSKLSISFLLFTHTGLRAKDA